MKKSFKQILKDIFELLGENLLLYIVFAVFIFILAAVLALVQWIKDKKSNARNKNGSY